VSAAMAPVPRWHSWGPVRPLSMCVDVAPTCVAGLPPRRSSTDVHPPSRGVGPAGGNRFRGSWPIGVGLNLVSPARPDTRHGPELRPLARDTRVGESMSSPAVRHCAIAISPFLGDTKEHVCRSIPPPYPYV